MHKRGFALLEIVIVLAVIAILAGGGWYATHLQNEQSAVNAELNAESKAQQAVQQSNQKVGQEQKALNQITGTSTTIHLQENNSEFDLSINSDASPLITDPMGRRTGRDPATGKQPQEIPQSAYFEDRICDAAAGGDSCTGVTRTIQISQPSSGIYQLVLTGLDTGYYDMAVRTYENNGAPQADMEEKGSIASGSQITFKLNLSFTPNTTSTLTKISN